MIRLSEVRETLKKEGFHPSRRLGQNFLVDRNLAGIMVEALGAGKDDLVLEIGPGLGAVTGMMLEDGLKVTAVEKDAALCRLLDRQFGDNPDFELVNSDFLDLDPGSFLGSRNISKVISNLPYSAGTRILVELAKLSGPPETMVVTVQCEVAERIAARPGEKERSALSVWMQSAYDIETLRRIGPDCFWPRPDVESAMLRLTAVPDRVPPGIDKADLVKAGKIIFRHRRKQMRSILKTHVPNSQRHSAKVGEMLLASGIRPDARPGDLTLQQWICLTSQLKNFQSL
jgi:16S rRNA (adenine1518-N6/adenine1519-N6)-dimethyltransferase